MQMPEAWYRVSIKALIYNDKGQVLLCQEDDGTWDFLGGGLDHGEEVEEGLKREIIEEMGLKVTKILKEPKHFLIFHKPDSKTRPWVANVFLGSRSRKSGYYTELRVYENGFFGCRNSEENKNISECREIFRNFCMITYRF